MERGEKVWPTTKKAVGKRARSRELDDKLLPLLAIDVAEPEVVLHLTRQQQHTVRLAQMSCMNLACRSAPQHQHARTCKYMRAHEANIHAALHRESAWSVIWAWERHGMRMPDTAQHKDMRIWARHRGRSTDTPQLLGQQFSLLRGTRH